MADIQVKRVQGSSKKLNLRELYALVCYYYPAYTLKDAQELPARDLRLLIKTARRKNAEQMHDLVIAISAPHAKNKNTAKNLLEHYKKIIQEK